MKGKIRDVAAIFAEARSLGSTTRARYLERACAGDTALRGEVEALLEAHDAAPTRGESDPFLPPRPDVASHLLDPAEAITPAVPDVPGFRIVHLLAEGGMGAVYVAEQDKPRRRVALKVLLEESATPDGRRRFEREADALARLEHPGIARVFLFGMTHGPGEPRPFLAMELVEGVSLTAAARNLDLDLDARVDLLTEITEAIAHAHAKGVIHRDLKPDNILVPTSRRPKVVDFGVARLVDDDIGLRTHAGLVIGTLAYMSPEQARGDTAAIDVRSDVYALGVIAYEVLCGRHPLGDAGGTYTNIVRRIQLEEPPHPGVVDDRLRGGLDLILRKALAKEPHRRYATAGNLAEDLRRYGADEPLIAQPPTGTYYLRRFLRRHKPLVAGSLATILALVAGLWIALAFAKSERQQRLRADRSAVAMERALADRNTDLAAASLRERAAVTAVLALEAVPAEFRGWEWRYLDARTNESVSHVPLAVGQLRDARLGVPPHPSLVQAGDLSVLALDQGTAKPRTVTPATRTATPHIARLEGVPVIVNRIGQILQVLDADGRLLHRLPLGQEKPIARAAGSRNGRWLAIAQDGGQGWCPLTVYDLSRGEATLNSAASVVTTNVLLLDEERGLVFDAGWNGTIYAQGIGKRGPRVHTLKGHSYDVLALALSPDGRRLASGGRDRTVLVWDLATGQEIFRVDGDAGEANALAFTPDGTRLVVGAQDATLSIWKVETGDLDRVLCGHLGPIRDLWFQDDVLETLGEDGVRRWQTSTSNQVLRHHEEGRLRYVYGVDFAPDGRQLASAGWDGTVRISDVDHGTLVRTLDAFGPRPYDVRWSPNGRWVLGGRDILCLWDVREDRAHATRSLSNSLECLDFVGPDGKTAVIGDEKGALHLLRTEDLEPLASWTEPHGALAELAVSPTGDRVATISANGHVVVRTLPTGEVLWRIHAHHPIHLTANCPGLAWSPDGQWIATGGADRCVRLWSASSGQALREMKGHVDSVYALAWLPDGSRLASGANDGTILIWDPATGGIRLRLDGHTGYVYRMAFSRDGSTLASASGDGTVRLWSARRMSARARRGPR